MALFKIEGLSFKYPEEEELILDNISLEIQEGSFITICGKSGSGKTTLLKHLKPVLTPYGPRKGEIYFRDKPMSSLDTRSQTMKIGYVLQNPEQQIVTDKVWHELAFGLESLGYDGQRIRLRVAEMASFLGIQNWFHKSVSELSGGQKQLLNLAAVMVMQPEVLVLDEPTAQLDPIATRNFIAMLKRINLELGTTIILSEHHLEEVLPLSDEMIVMESGKKLIQGSVREVGAFLSRNHHELFKGMSVGMQVTEAISRATNQKISALTVKEGRHYLRKYIEENNTPWFQVSEENFKEVSKTLLKIEDVYFRYEKHGQDILKGVTWQINKGRLYTIVGGNGTGKTTMLTVLAGLYKPYRGKVKWLDKSVKSVMLPQNPMELFECNSVQEELEEMLMNLPVEERQAKLKKVIQLLELEKLLNKHPYDLSGGQMQCVALGKILLLEPQVILLDEPTKGVDIDFKEKLGDIFKHLTEQGMTLVMISHDLDFCAKYSDECALFFDGQVVSSDKTRAFFMGNNFYTTAANRLSKGLIEGCITSEEVIRYVKLTSNKKL